MLETGRWQIEKGQAYGRDQLIEEFSAKGSELDVVGPEGYC